MSLLLEELSTVTSALWSLKPIIFYKTFFFPQDTDKDYRDHISSTASCIASS